MATDNSTETLLHRARDELHKTETLLGDCRRMTDPRDPESVQIDWTIRIAIASLRGVATGLKNCTDELGGAS